MAPGARNQFLWCDMWHLCLHQTSTDVSSACFWIVYWQSYTITPCLVFLIYSSETELIVCTCTLHRVARDTFSSVHPLMMTQWLPFLSVNWSATQGTVAGVSLLVLCLFGWVCRGWGLFPNVEFAFIGRYCQSFLKQLIPCRLLG